MNLSKDDGKPKQMTWRVFRPAPAKPKPEPTVDIILKFSKPNSRSQMLVLPTF